VSAYRRLYARKWRDINVCVRLIEVSAECVFIANEPAERRRSAVEAAEKSAARSTLYGEKFSIDL